MLCAGIVHGDLSEYNVLLGGEDGKPVKYTRAMACRRGREHVSAVAHCYAMFGAFTAADTYNRAIGEPDHEINQSGACIVCSRDIGWMHRGAGRSRLLRGAGILRAGACLLWSTGLLWSLPGDRNLWWPGRVPGLALIPRTARVR